METILGLFILAFFGFIIYYIYRYNIKLGKRKEKLISFYETVPFRFTEEILRYISYNVLEGKEPINFIKEGIELNKIYFAGATLCLDVHYLIINKSAIITISSDGSIGWFDPYGWCDGYCVVREILPLVELGIYRDICKKLKNKIMSKFYCVYLAWPKWEVMPSNAEGYDKLPRYPRDCARVRVYDNPSAQLEAYANTPCPASQLFEANTKEEIKQKVEDFKNKFEDEKWLKENIDPFI